MKKNTHWIGVDLGGTNVRAGLVTNDRISNTASQPIDGQGSKEKVLGQVCAMIDAVMVKGVKGIGLGVPSLLDPANGVIHDTTNIPSWKNVPLRKLLEKKYKVPVRINNDANCFTLGEKMFGQGKKAENFVGVILGTGLGVGIVANGQLYSGVYCGAGEFGIIPYRDSILEHYAGGRFFQQYKLDGAEVSRRASGGDKEALAIFEAYGKHVGHAVKILLLALAPEMIIFGGSVSKDFSFFAPSMQASLESFAYPSLVKQLKFKVSRLNHGAILGAASLLTEENNR